MRRPLFRRRPMAGARAATMGPGLPACAAGFAFEGEPQAGLAPANRLIAMTRPLTLLLLLVAGAPLARAADPTPPRFRLTEARLRVEPVSADGRFRVEALRLAGTLPGSSATSRFTLKNATPSKALCNPAPAAAIFGNGFESP
jgi:hypothetical protein